MYTYPHRREYYKENGEVEPYHPNPWGYFDEETEGRMAWANLISLSNKSEDFINWYKNHLLIKYFLKDKKCNWLWDGFRNIPIDYNEPNRFDGNYGIFIDLGVDGTHPGPKHNKEYATKLFNHIYKNFNEYLPSGLTQPPKSLI
jgi:hypothetical protein